MHLYAMAASVRRARAVLRLVLILLVVNVVLVVFISRRRASVEEFAPTTRFVDDDDERIGESIDPRSRVAKAASQLQRNGQADVDSRFVSAKGELKGSYGGTGVNEHYTSELQQSLGVDDKGKHEIIPASKIPEPHENSPSSEVHQNLGVDDSGRSTPPPRKVSHLVNKPSRDNRSYLPVKWKINSVQDLSRDHHTSGIITQPNSNRTGFVLAMEYWDQQTFSVQNLLSLQAWAGWLGVSVLEPFLMWTKFGLPLGDPKAFHENGTVSYPAMGDLYDVDQWNAESNVYFRKLSLLTQWSDFLSSASRDVVLVGFSKWEGCKLNKNLASYNKSLTKIGFRLVDTRCIGRSTVTESSLKREVYGDNLSPSNVTVIFDCWNRQDVLHVIREMTFRMIAGSFIVSLQPSKKLVEEATQYTNKHLTLNGDYIGILVRAEWIIMNRGPEKRGSILSDCLNRAIGWLRAVGNTTGITATFVGMDIGRFGSTTLRDLSMDYITKVGENFLRVAYREPQMTLEEWENTFIDVTSSRIPGYLAFLQKTVAVRGKCLLLVGYGSFQSHALQAYMNLHDKRDHCFLKTDSQCKIELVAGFDP